MSKKYFLGFNWKMNPNKQTSAEDLFLDYQEASLISTNTKIVIFPPNLYLGILQNRCLESNSISDSLKLGSQDISKENSGAFTSEISGEMLSDLSINYCLIGHSETRQMNSLTNQIVNQKVNQTLNNNLSPVLCIGYSKNPEIDFEELKTQVLEGLENCQEILIKKANSNQKIILAYEPVWAIGSGKAASLEIVNQVLDFLKNLIKQEIPLILDKVLILYGGSVSDQNVLELTQAKSLDGFLIGGASLSKSKFEPILTQLNSLNIPSN